MNNIANTHGTAAAIPGNVVAAIAQMPPGAAGDFALLLSHSASAATPAPVPVAATPLYAAVASAAAEMARSDSTVATTTIPPAPAVTLALEITPPQTQETPPVAALAANAADTGLIASLLLQLQTPYATTPPPRAACETAPTSPGKVRQAPSPLPATNLPAAAAAVVPTQPEYAEAAQTRAAAAIEDAFILPVDGKVLSAAASTAQAASPSAMTKSPDDATAESLAPTPGSNGKANAVVAAAHALNDTHGPPGASPHIQFPPGHLIAASANRLPGMPGRPGESLAPEAVPPRPAGDAAMNALAPQQSAFGNRTESALERARQPANVARAPEFNGARSVREPAPNITVTGTPMSTVDSASQPHAMESAHARDAIGVVTAAGITALPAAALRDRHAPPVLIAPRVTSPEWQPVFASNVRLLVNEGTPAASLQLNPAEFGPIDVRIVVTNQRADISFLVTHPDANAAIQSALAELRDQLAQSGIQLGKTSVGEHPQEYRQPAATQGQASRQQNASPAGDALRADTPLPSRPRASGQIDTFA